jgi:hypothetical protein
MITNILLKKKINLTPYFLISNLKKKKKQPSHATCALISFYFNMKLLKTPNSLTTFKYP